MHQTWFYQSEISAHYGQIWNKICHTVNSCGDFFMIGPSFTRFDLIPRDHSRVKPFIVQLSNVIQTMSTVKVTESWRNYSSRFVTLSPPNYPLQTGSANRRRSTDFRNADQRSLIFLSKAWSQVIKMPRLCLKDAWKETPAERNLANQSQVEYRNIAHSDRCVVSLSKKHLLSKSTDNTLEAVAPSRRDWNFFYWRICPRFRQ